MSRPSRWYGIVAVSLAVALVGGCGSNREDKKASATQPIARYASVGPRAVPEYLKGTIYEKADLQGTKPYLVSGFGLVGQLRQTGDNSALSNSVREYIRKEILRHGFGSFNNPTTPEAILRDKSYAVVRVDALIPPGCRKDDRFDILVSVPAESNTTSLSHGVLYQTSLKYMGADPAHPGGLVNTQVTAQGPVFVNPQYALVSKNNLDPAGRKSVLYGVVMDGGISLFDYPLEWRVRDPQFATARAIEARINQRFQGITDRVNQKGIPAIAAAQDEALVHVYVPKIYRGDYEHFAGVVKHLYMDSNPGTLAIMAEKLAAAAEEPDAPLENISYALEGIGEPAQAVLGQMMKSPRPEVAYSAARAAAFIGDDIERAREVLVKMAKTPDHPFRLNAVKTLGDLGHSSDSETNRYLRELVNVDNTAVRIEAYKALARNNDYRVYSRVIQEKFVLDLVPSSGAAPLIYASRRGIPRIAIFGTRQAMQTPVTYATIDSRLSFSADQAGGPVTLFYRADRAFGDHATLAIKQSSRPDLVDIVARLGGEAPQDEQAFDFSYADVVSIIQGMHQAGKLKSQGLDGMDAPITLVIEEQTGISNDDVMSAPRIPETMRVQDDRPESTAPQIPDSETPKPPAATVPTSGGRAN